MCKPKAFIFDLLTALLDSWSVWDISIPDDEKHIASGQTWRKRYLELTYSCGAYVEYELLVKQAAKDVGLSTAASTGLSARWDMIQPWPEVAEVLAGLKEQGYLLGVVTNCSNVLGIRAVTNCESAVGGGFKFDTVVTAEQSGFYKPHAKPYEDALNKLGVTAGETVFVAGSPADIPGASGVGMRVVWNNHAGLARKDHVKPWREGSRLDEALQGCT